MKRKLNSLLIFSYAFSCLTILLSACNKDDEPPQPGEIVMAKEVNIIADKTWDDNFISLDSTNYTLNFSNNISSSQQFRPGDIIISSRGDGLLRKVKNVSNVNNKVILQTEFATLTDAIKQGKIEFKKKLTVSEIKGIDYHYPGINLSNNSLTKGAQETQTEWDIDLPLYDYDDNPETTYDQIRLEGQFSFDWTLAATIEIDYDEGLKEVKFGFESNENLNLQLIAGIQFSVEQKRTLATIDFTPIVVMVGVVPVIFTPQLKIIAGISGYTNASITSELDQTLSFNAGMKYLKDVGWAPFNEFNKSLTCQPPHLNMNAGAQLYLKPELTIKIYGVAGPYANLKLYGKLDANLLQNPWWKLYGGITMNAGVKAEILDLFLLEYSINDLLKYELLLAQSSGPPAIIPSLTTSNISSVTQTSAIGGGVVTNEGGANVTVRGICWSTSQNPTIADSKSTNGTGTGSFTSDIVGLSPYTTYYVRAYATNSAGTAYGNQVSFMTSPNSTIPTLTTTGITNIFTNSATSGGTINSDGGATVTARGVCWSTAEDPTPANSHTSNGTGIGTFISNITGLSPNTTYYVRAYGTNSAGTGYGNQVSFNTPAVAVIPSLTTTATSYVTSSNAVGGGNISNEGGAFVTNRGVCWSISPDPTTSNNITSDGTGSGTFTSNIPNLSPSTTYYVRAYATNSAGTSYGNQISFTTSPSAVMPTISTTAVSSIFSYSATSGGTIPSDGGAAITSRGVCWSTLQNPTISNSKTFDGAGIGSFSSNITGLLPSTTYYLRAYSTNSVGTSYGNQVSFTTSPPPVIPTLTTTTASSIGSYSAVSGGNISSDGGASVTSRGVCWSTSQSPTTANSKTSDGTGAGSFTSNITGLSASTTYYARAFATNSLGTAYGNQISFTTSPPPVIPTLTTTTVTSIGSYSAVSGGNISSNGGASVTSRGVCWSTSQSPTTANSKTSNGSGSGIFISDITGLSPNTTYFVRAYATNSAGTSYGNQVSFTTSSPPVIPTLTTTTASSIGSYSAVSGGNISNNGGASVTSRGVCWSTSQNPTTANSKTSNGSGSGIFISDITGLSPNTTYFVRAYATNSAGTSYGNQITFTTLEDVNTIIFNPNKTYGSISDIEGNVYKTIQIGNQTWMAENLRTKKFNDNTNISLVTSTSAWVQMTTPGYCWYNNDETTYKNLYGGLYNWFAVNTGKLCPTGWHVPNESEWNTLILSQGLFSTAGGKLKEIGYSHWSSPNTGATNESGFTALPGSFRNQFGTFYILGDQGVWWNSQLYSGLQSGGIYLMDSDTESCGISGPIAFWFGASVRCIKN